MKSVVVIAMKGLDKAKSRLAPYMGDASRQSLATELFDATRRSLGVSLPDFEHLVITPSVDIASRSLEDGWSALVEEEPCDLNHAAAQALGWARAHGMERMLFVPADILVWDDRELQTLLGAGVTHDVVIARASDGGTNALLLRTASVGAFDFRYGNRSADRHARVARLADLHCCTLVLPHLAHDLDTVEDCLATGLALA